MSNIYYNPSSATGDSRSGHGYGKSQSKMPSIGTGIGSEYIMGSSQSGIYPDPVDDVDDEDQLDVIDDDDIDKFVRKIHRIHVVADPAGAGGRADRSSLGHSSNRFSTVGLSENDRMPGVRKGISPFSSRALHPNGFNGPAIGSGGSGQAFRTTGPIRRTGTQYGTSRAPINRHDPAELEFISLLDLINLPNDEKNFLKHQLRIKKILRMTESLERLG